MNWTKINDGLWKAEEGGYEILVFFALSKDVKLYGWSIKKYGAILDNVPKYNKQLAKKEAEKALQKLVKMKDYYDNISSCQPMIEQLKQLTHLTWDGDLVSKVEQSKLVNEGLAQRITGGWNLITPKGISYLEKLGFIHP